MAATIENRSNVANQALQQTIYGGATFLGSTDDQGKEQEDCLAKLLLKDPKEAKDALKARKGHRVNGTCEWFLNTPQLIRWRDSRSSKTNLFWLAGHPGTGKSTLAIFLAETLERHLAAENGALLAYFFCDTSAHDQNTAVAILRGFIYQMCRQHTTLLDRYLLPEWRVKKEKIFTSFDALWSIFSQMATDTPTGQKFFILDALDECDSQSQRLLLDQLDRCFAQPDLEPESPSNVHFLITSRPYTEIREILDAFPHEDMSNFAEVQRDVESFVKEKVAKLAQRKKYTAKIQKEVTDILTLKAEGTFLWVGLACTELEKLSAKAGLDRIKGLPSGLISIYDSLMNRALQEASESGEDPEMVKRILQVVAIAMEPVTLQELAVACRLHEDEDDEERRLYTENTIDLCRLMVVVDGKYVRLLHKSVKDFLFKSASGDVTDVLGSHASLAYRCIDLLIADYHARQRGATTDFDDCFVGYAAQYWPEHANQAQDRFRVIPHQQEFFSHVSASREAWITFSLALGEDILLYFSLFHVAALWGILPLLDHMESESYLNDNSLQGSSKLDTFSAGFKRFQGNPLKVAIAEDDSKVLRRLLNFSVVQVDGRLSYKERGITSKVADDTNCFSFPVTPDIIMTAVTSSVENLELLLTLRKHEVVLNQDIIEEAALDQASGQHMLGLFHNTFDNMIHLNHEILQAAVSNPNIDNTMVHTSIKKAIESNSSLSMQRILEVLVQFRDAPTIDKFRQYSPQILVVNVELMEALSQRKLHKYELVNHVLETFPQEAVVVNQGLVDHVVQHFDLEALSNIVDIGDIAVTEELLVLAAKNTHCADSMVSVLLSYAPNIAITEYVLKAAVSNREHLDTTLPVLFAQGLAEVVSASSLLQRAISARSNIYGVTQALAADYPGLLRQITDRVFQALAIECESTIEPLSSVDAQKTMVELLTNQMFRVELTAAMVEAVAVTSTPEEYLWSWLLDDDEPQLVYSLGFWDHPIQKFSLAMIQSLLTRMDDPSSALMNLTLSAVTANRQDVIKSVLLGRSDITVRDMTFSSVMYEAVVCGNISIMQMLIDHGMRLEDYHFGSPVLVRAAASSGQVSILQRLFDMGAELPSSNDGVACPLKAAIASSKGRERSGQMVKMLLDHGADPNTNHKFYGNVLQQAAVGGHLAAVEALLDTGANINARDENYGSALQAAVCATRQWHEITNVLIERGADINIQGGEHGSAIGAALSNGRLELANLLLRRGAQLPKDAVNRVLADASPLKRTLAFLLRHGASVGSHNEYGWSGLHIVIRRFGWFAATSDVFRMLYEAGADISARGRAGRTPLIEASAHGGCGTVQWLLSVGASVHDRDKFGCTALHYAVQEELEVAMVLVAAGADMGAVDGNGSTILHRAASSGRDRIVEWILDSVKLTIEHYPASARAPEHISSVSNFINHFDFMRRTALHLALNGDHTGVVETLVINGAHTDLANEYGMTLESWSDASYSQRVQWASLPSSIVLTASSSLAETYTTLRTIISMIRDPETPDKTRYHRWLAHYLALQDQIPDATTALEQCLRPCPSPDASSGGIEHDAICDDCGTRTIIGTRHRCTVCSDCDLCNDCWEKGSFFSQSTCCGGHSADFIPIPQSSWPGFGSAVVNSLGETRDQWLDRLDRIFGPL